ncbi:MAG TPA: heavy metal translocating P-type ATPase metal-binding domain-containing protein, partial [Daejeonella sp.]|nr:heavy metal translocating P-type ATPase metal-binding domain-containing protein [Daejeonella sp.]
VTTSLITNCYHCGTECEDTQFHIEEKNFCCAGCQSVFQILNSNNLCNYYVYNDNPGQNKPAQSQHFEYLDEPTIIGKLVDFTDQDLTVVTFYIPAIHCSSCIWLLEHLHKLNSAVVHSRIDFLKKEVSITFRHAQLSLRQLVELLCSISYEPLISLQDIVKEKKNSVNRDLIKKIGVAGFCMGNVMLFTFPEYLGISASDEHFKQLFSWLNLALAIPVTFYSGRDFFISSWAGLKNKMFNLDTPLALIIAVLFLRTSFEVITQTGPGFTDTLSGLVFLLLMGRWVKQRTYYHLSFERDYRSYFPVAVTVIRKGEEKPLAINELSVSDRILIRNNEIIPADSILMKGEGYIDFSFVTGESSPVQKVMGEIVYAGGRQMGEVIELEVIKPVSQSYLTRLWNNDTFSASENRIKNFNDSIAKYFSVVVFILAIASAGYWVSVDDTAKAWNAFTAILIVACPCVLALSTPFTLSAVLGIFDKNRFYLKNTDVVEQLARIDTLVFDKTGTISSPEAVNLSFSEELTIRDKNLIASLARNSMHPLSREIVKWLSVNAFSDVADYRETAGKGISGIVNGHSILIGSSVFAGAAEGMKDDSSTVHVAIDNKYQGFFRIKQQWRTGLKSFISGLKDKFNFHLISGDNENDRSALTEIFPKGTSINFTQSPQDKLEYIKTLQSSGEMVMMLGDGLNDAGALKQSNLGVAVTDDINNFTPGCDAILDGASFQKLPQFIRQSKQAIKTIRRSFVISASYNLVGVYFAVQGTLSPLTAAVLMPISTITIITFTSMATHYYARKNHLK